MGGFSTCPQHGEQNVFAPFVTNRQKKNFRFFWWFKKSAYLCGVLLYYYTDENVIKNMINNKLKVKER